MDGGSARAATSARAGASSSSPAAITPPPITTTSGLKMFTKLAIATPRFVPISAQHLDRRLVAVVRELGHERTGELAPVGKRSAEPGVGALAARHAEPPAQAPSPTRATRRSRGWGSCPGRAARPYRSRRGRAHRPRRSPPRYSSPRRISPPPIPVPIVSIDGLARAARGAGAVLGERRHVGVVVDEHRQPQPLGHDRRRTGCWPAAD